MQIGLETDERRSTSGYCTFVWGNLVTWQSKKQAAVARSSVEAELRVIAHCLWKLVADTFARRAQGGNGTTIEDLLWQQRCNKHLSQSSASRSHQPCGVGSTLYEGENWRWHYLQSLCTYASASCGHTHEGNSQTRVWKTFRQVGNVQFVYSSLRVVSKY